MAGNEFECDHDTDNYNDTVNDNDDDDEMLMMTTTMR
jgi:hypothetical protein